MVADELFVAEALKRRDTFALVSRFEELDTYCAEWIGASLRSRDFGAKLRTAHFWNVLLAPLWSGMFEVFQFFKLKKGNATLIKSNMILLANEMSAAADRLEFETTVEFWILSSNPTTVNMMKEYIAERAKVERWTDAKRQLYRDAYHEALKRKCEQQNLN